VVDEGVAGELVAQAAVGDALGGDAFVDLALPPEGAPFVRGAAGAWGLLLTGVVRARAAELAAPAQKTMLFGHFNPYCFYGKPIKTVDSSAGVRW